MAVSNKLGHMVLSTGNKSEMSVGYATLYGDMCGGRNQEHPGGALGPSGRVIPERIITKAPTAELRPNQTDQDSLPPYEALDDILEGLIEHEMGVDRRSTTSWKASSSTRWGSTRSPPAATRR
jgi:NAD+ synthase